MNDESPSTSSPPPVDRRFFGRVLGASLFFLLIGLGIMWGYYALQDEPAIGFDEAANPAPPLLMGQPATPNRVRLFFTGDGVTLVPEMRDITAPSSIHDRAQLIMKELLAGPRTGTLRSAIPRGAKLQAIYIRDDAAVLDFSSELRNQLHPDVISEVLCIYGVVNSLLLNMPALKSVTILVDGSPVPTLRGTVDLTAPLVPNVSLIAGERRV